MEMCNSIVDNWIQLTYGDGDSYVNVCNNATRSASIMFICGPNKVRKKESLKEIERKYEYLLDKLRALLYSCSSLLFMIELVMKMS